MPLRFQKQANSSQSAQQVFVPVQRYLNETLKLVINQQKSYVGSTGGCEYLGFQFGGRDVTIEVALKKLTAFKRRIKDANQSQTGHLDETPLVRASQLPARLDGLLWIG